MSRAPGREPESESESFAAALSRRTGWRQVSFAVREHDYSAVIKAKRRFGAAALGRAVARIAWELLRLCRIADRK